MQLQSTRVSLDDEYAVMQHFWEQGWTDGLPIVAPTPDRVEVFVAAAGLEPEAMVGAYQTRATALTAEKLAVNAVMAGCKPEYMPVLVAAFEGLTDPAYRMNHMASLGSPWPLIIVNGPIVKEIGMTTGQYVMGGGNHANATIGRAVSLTMANCFGAKVGGVQRGCLGNPNRWSFCIAENEDTPWTPLHAQRGFQAEESAVTVFGSMNGFDQFVTPNFNEPVFLCELMAQRIANGFFTLGSYVVVMAPTYQQHFLDAGWSKDDVRDYLLKHVKRSVRSLKIDGRWERYGTRLSSQPPVVEPGDENRFVHMRHDEAYRKILWQDAEWPRKMDFLIVIAGGEAGNFGGYLAPYPLATEPVTKKVRT